MELVADVSREFSIILFLAHFDVHKLTLMASLKGYVERRDCVSAVYLRGRIEVPW